MMALTTAGTTTGGSDLWSEARLAEDMALQMSLLKSDSALSNTFKEAVMSGSVTSEQFWSTRIHLLRAHALEKSQIRGPYNVLAAVRSTTVDGVARISLSREQIADIFSQHPLVKIVYDENVPRVSEDQFWSRFFLSRLFKKLKGDKLLQTDPTDTLFDRYLNRDDEDNSRKRRRIDYVPLTIDLAGNEQNITKGRGNAPDMTMRPSRVENTPIIRTLNSLSHKLVDLVAPADPNRDEDQDEHYIQEQRLADLGGDMEEERIILNIQDQRNFFSNEQDDGGKGQNKFAGMDATVALEGMIRDLGTNHFDISDILPNEEDEDMEDMDGTATARKTSFHLATKQVTEAVRDRTSQMISVGAAGTASSLFATTGGLPREVFESVQSVHATTNEFLHHFWLAFLSGDEKRAKDINSMVSSLRKSKDRIEAVAITAEEQKEVERVKRKRDLHEEYKKTGIKPKKKDMEVGGGRKVVDEMLAPTLVAIEKALVKYESALDEAEKLAAAA
ncbi:hypothetical protein BZA05DRAFT_405904 [Tricharina praecox]|uniref:uncharacterized protein n=1 Tax=Tricharina praecox TaxID=43433 RepID=UPI00221E47B4|nr:uncharacterized protein BZA05DRAFT_405904 [Tricharina praecox]KAI5846935.1 hypothetical protein BZA05DRAFT_405904 [Tricharina praecox]